MDVFPKLLTGLDVNVKFQKVQDFEFTQDVTFFDMVGINLYHGWLADPQSPAYEVVKNYSYNQALEIITLYQQMTQTENSSKTSNESDSPVEKQNEIQNSEEKDRIMKEGIILKDWLLLDTAHQLTYHGIIELTRNMKNGELAVFFRNNHFSTLYKKGEYLYLLVTDQGFLNESNVVWEVLNETDGDTQFVDANFNLFHQSHSNILISTSPTDDSYARTLQAEEDREYARLLNQQQQHHHHHYPEELNFRQDNHLYELEPTIPTSMIHPHIQQHHKPPSKKPVPVKTTQPPHSNKPTKQKQTTTKSTNEKPTKPEEESCIIL